MDCVMLAKLRKFLVNIYVHLAGVRFYSSDTIPVKREFRKFIVKTLHGYEITFTFYKEKREFIKYFFKKLKRRHCTIYVVCATFDDKAPVSVKRYNNMRIFVNDSSLFLRDENIIVMSLLHVYLDYLLFEMRSCMKRNVKQVDDDKVAETKEVFEAK